jgi:hypothetical protein
MVYDTYYYYNYGIHPSSGILQETAFQRLDLFSSSDVKVRNSYSLGIDRALPAFSHEDRN